MYEQSDIYPYRREYGSEATRKKRKNKRQKRSAKAAGSSLYQRLFGGWCLVAESFSIEGILLATAGFFLGRTVILGELHPFGSAYLIAVIAVLRGYLPIALPAVLVGMFTVLAGSDVWAQFFVLIFLALVGLLYPLNYERRWLTVPIVVLVTHILVKGVFAVFFEPTLYRWVAIIFEGAFAAALSAAFMQVLSALGKDRDILSVSPEESISAVIMAVGVLGGMDHVAFKDISLMRIAGNALVMLAALCGGAGSGAAAGTLMGVIPSITRVAAPALIGVSAVSGMLSGIFNSYGKLGVIGGYILGNLIFSIYFLDQAAVMIRFLEIVLSSLVLLFVSPRWQSMLEELLGKSSVLRSSTQLASVSSKKVKDLARVFSELAASFSQTAFAVEKTDWEGDTKKLLEMVAGKVCYQCPLVNKCWKTEYSATSKSMLRLFSLAEGGGRVSPKYISSHLNARCARAGEIATAVNFLMETYRVDRYWRRRLKEHRELVTLQLNGVAEVMHRLVNSLSLEVEKRVDLEATLSRELSREGITAYELSVLRCGRKDLEVNIKHQSCGGEDVCYKKVLPVVSRVMGRPYTLNGRVCPVHSGAANCQLSLVPAWAFSLETGCAQSAKMGTAVCGDQVATLHLQEGKKALLISDGMGTGPRAARESTVTVNMLHQLLETGFSLDLTVKTVNSVMAMRTVEDSFTTLDLAMIDLYTGEAEFVKVGAAPSWIKRGHRLEVISQGNIPIGILKNIEVESVQETLQVGDLLVMVSDGMLGKGGERWLQETLMKLDNDNPQQAADYLLNRALDRYGGLAPDDISVLVARLDRKTLRV